MRKVTFQSKTKTGRAMVLGDSPEHRKLQHAVAKANGDREVALRNVCRLFKVKSADALPPGVLAAAVAMITGRKRPRKTRRKREPRSGAKKQPPSVRKGSIERNTSAPPNSATNILVKAGNGGGRTGSQEKQGEKSRRKFCG